MAKGCISDSEAQQYHEKGYVLAKGFFDTEEVELLRRAAKEDRALDQHSFSRDDGKGATSGSRFGIIPATPSTACSRAANPSWTPRSKLLDDEVYHYHSKMIMKDAQGRRRLGLAPGLRLLVSEWRALPDF